MTGTFVLQTRKAAENARIDLTKNNLFLNIFCSFQFSNLYNNTKFYEAEKKVSKNESRVLEALRIFKRLVVCDTKKWR